MFDVITVGSSTSDIFLHPEDTSLVAPPGCAKNKTCHKSLICWNYGEKINVEEVHYDIGGSACNVAVGLSRLGFNTAIISALGKDLGAERVKNQFTKEKVSDSYLKTFSNFETSFSVIITYRGERTILVYHGLRDYSKLNIPKNLSTKWLYVGPLGNNYGPLYNKIISLVSQKNIHLALNPGVIQLNDLDHSLKSILRVTKILFLNKEEAIDLVRPTNILEAKDLLIKVLELGPEVVVITDGKNGAMAGTKKEFWQISSLKVDVRDSTGAGDAFSSGFLASYINNQNIKESLKWGIINSTSVIENIGAQAGLMKMAKLKRDLIASPKLYSL